MFKKILTAFNLALFIIVIFAFSIRIIGISEYPVGFTQDEASFGYDAYSLLKTGKDQWGTSFPLVLRSFGDFKLPLYSYLAIPIVAIFGLNEFATRLPNAIMGGLAVFMTYLFVAEMSKNKKLALVATVFLALSPWHIQLSRGAFEANLAVFFMSAGVWSFLRGLKSANWMVISALAFGLNLFSYHSARIMTLLLLPIIFYFFLKGQGINRAKLVQQIFLVLKKYYLSLFIFLIFIVLMFYSLLIGAGQRGSDILIINPTDKWSAVADRRYEAVLRGLADPISRAFSNKVTYILDVFTNNYLSYLSPIFLFTQGAGEATYGMIQGRGVMYSIELLFIVISLFAFVKKERFKGMEFIIIWILVSPLAAALTKGPGYAANRVAVMMPAIQILSAYGFLFFAEMIARKIRIKSIKPLYYFMGGLFILISFLAFSEDYLYHNPIHAAQAMHYGMRDLFTSVSVEEGKYKEIRVSRSLSVPQIWVAFYNKWDPGDYQNESRNWLVYESSGFKFIDQLEGYKLGKYSFGTVDWSVFKNSPGYLLVGKSDEFPREVQPMKRFYYPDTKASYSVVSP